MIYWVLQAVNYNKWHIDVKKRVILTYWVSTSVLTITTNDILSVYNWVSTSVLTITTNDILSVYKRVNYNNKWYIECLQAC